MRSITGILPRRSRLIYYRDLLREMVSRDLKLRYKRSVLGIAWSLLNPLAQMLVFTFLFRRVLPLNIPNYPVFVFTGVLVWSWFSNAIMVSAGVIVDNRELIKRPGFPVPLLPVITVTTNLIQFLLALPILFAAIIIGGGALSISILLLPLIILIQFILTVSLGYIVSTLQVTFRDTQHLLSVLLLLLFYLTPVFYDSSMVPARFLFVYELNPMVHLMRAYRAILVLGVAPDPIALLALSALALLLLWLGLAIFIRASYRFVEEL